MKLKRVWTAICIYILFVIFDVTMVASSGFFSGLFPSDNALLYTGAFTALSVVITGVLMFVFGKISDNIDTTELSNAPFSKLIYVLLLITVLFGSVVYRNDVLSLTTAAPGGKLSLYENAKVGTFSMAVEQDLLSILYSKLLNMVLIFTGNRITFALFFQLALFVVFIFCCAIVARLLLGKAASIVVAAYLAFMPVFSDGLKNVKIETDELFYLLFGIELLILAIYLKIDSEGGYRSKVFGLWYLFVGVTIGFMTYVDAGTLIVILPLLLSGLLIVKNSIVSEIFRLLFILVGGLTTFFGLILQEGGVENFDAVIYNWSHYFFKNINTFNTFWTYTNYKIEYLATFVVMTGVIFGFWRNRRYEKISSWLFSTMIVFFATPFFGATRTNSEIMLTVFFAFVLGAVVSLITMESHENALLSEIEIDENEEETENASPSSEPYPEHLVVKPEVARQNPLEPEMADKENADLGDDDTQKADVDRSEASADTVSESRETGESADSVEYYDEDEEGDLAAESHEAKEIADSEEAPIDTESASEADNNEAGEESDEFVVDRDSQPQNVLDTDEISSKNAAFDNYAARFVPEGMVLPVGAEDEMDLSESHMKMPEFKGTIALNRGKETAEPACAEDNTEAQAENRVESASEINVEVHEEHHEEIKDEISERTNEEASTETHNTSEVIAKPAEPETIERAIATEPVPETIERASEPERKPVEKVDDILERLLAEKLEKERLERERLEKERLAKERTQSSVHTSRAELHEAIRSYEPEKNKAPIQDKVQNKPEKPAKKYKYEFDIALKPGDDFDIE